MKGLTIEKRDEIISRILDDIQVNMFQYERFVLECVAETLKEWDDEDLLDWIGEDIGEEGKEEE